MSASQMTNGNMKTSFELNKLLEYRWRSFLKNVSEKKNQTILSNSFIEIIESHLTDMKNSISKNDSCASFSCGQQGSLNSSDGNNSFNSSDAENLFNSIDAEKSFNSTDKKSALNSSILTNSFIAKSLFNSNLSNSKKRDILGNMKNSFTITPI